MIPELEGWHRQSPTPGLVRLATLPAAAAQAVVDGRRSEEEGRSGDAAQRFRDALRLLEEASPASPLVADTRAAAQAGLVRLAPAERWTRSLRKQALARFRVAPSHRIDGADIGDHASLLDPDDPRRAELLALAGATGRIPAWVAGQLIEDADPDATRRLAWSIVRGVPGAASSHVRLAVSGGLSGSDRAAAFAVAAGLFLDDGEWSSARDAAEMACKLDSGSGVAALLLADILRLLGESEHALELLSATRSGLVAGSPLLRVHTRAYARALEAAGMRRDAIRMLAGVLEGDALSDDWVLAGRLHTALRERRRARKAFDRALELDPGSVPVVYSSVVNWLRLQRFDRPVVDVQRALERRPQDPYLHVLLGYLWGRQGRPDAPEDQVRRAVLLGMSRIEAWDQLAFLRGDQGDRRGAAEALARAIEAGGDHDPALLARYGEQLLRLGDVDEAITHYRRAARLRPADVPLQRDLAGALLSARRPRQALVVLDRALGRSPGSRELLAWRGRLHRILGDLERAERDLCNAIDGEAVDWPEAEMFWTQRDRHGQQAAIEWALEALDASSLGTLASGLWDSDDPWGALALADAALERAEALQPAGRSRLLLVQGLGRWQAGDGPRAERSLREATRLLPTDARAHALLGLYLAEGGWADEAEAEITAARSRDPGSEEIAMHAARALRAARGPARALEELDRAIFQIGYDLTLTTFRAELLLESGRAADALKLVADLRSMGTADAGLDRTEGLALADVGRYEEAVSPLTSVLAREPGDIVVRMSLAVAYNALGRAREALTVIEAVASDAVDAQVLLVRGEARRALGDARCLRDFQAALTADAGFHAARIELVDAAIEYGRRDLAIRHFEELEREPAVIDEPEMVRLAWYLDRPRLALERAAALLARNRSSGRTLVLKAGILLELGDHRAAIEAGRAAMDVDGPSVAARHVLSAALEAAGSLEEALGVLGEGDDQLLLRQRISVLTELGRSAEAGRLVSEALGRAGEQRDDRAWVQLGDPLVRQGVLEPVARLLAGRLRDSSSASLMHLTGTVLSGMGEFERAAAVLELARQLDRRLAGIDADLAWAYDNIQPARPEETLRTVNRALRRSPDDLYLRKTKAEALLKAGRSTAATRLYQAVLAGLSSSPAGQWSNWTAGWCHYRLGNHERALDHLLRSVSAAAQHDGADRFDLGLVLLASGHVSRARREYVKAISEAGALGDPLRRRGIVKVAHVDLTEMVFARSADNVPPVAAELQELLAKEVASARSALPEVAEFLRRTDALVAAGSIPA